MHTVSRFARSTLSAALVWGLFLAWGLAASLMSGSFDILIAVGAFTGVFFAPAAFAVKWEEIGD